MRVFKTNKVLNRLNQMIDNAVDGVAIENSYDETMMSALETKLAKYLAMNQLTKTQLSEEKKKINELVSDISHQTKTPLANILLYTQLLAESELSNQDQQYVTFLMEQAEKLNFLIHSMVKISRLETGIIAVHPKKNSFEEMIYEVIEQAKPKAQKKHIEINTKINLVDATFDRKWTVEALYNIVDNAIKYTQEGGTIQISTTQYQLFDRIDIADTGIGIDEEEYTKIFTRFYRSSSVADEDGVGIGLYLAREIITSQGGYIKVQSERNKGSIFSVFLPR